MLRATMPQKREALARRFIPMEEEHHSMDSEARILELEAKVAELTAFIDQVRAVQAPVATAIDAVAPTDTIESQVAAAEIAGIDEQPRTASRRGMLKLAGAAAAGAAAAVATHAMPAAALDNDPLIAGGEVATTAANRNTTELSYANLLVPQVPSFLFGASPANIFVARDTPTGIIVFDPSSSGYPAASAGYSYRTVANGMYGYTAMSGAGVVGSGQGAGAVGMLALGVGANIELLPGGTAPSTRTDAHRLGQVICDTAGDTWLCVVAGTPGTFRKLSGAAASGSLHLLPTPKRVYDSRAGEAPAIEPKSPLLNLAPRTIDCTANSSGVPANATGVLLNVTAISITANGFLAVTPGGAGFTGTSTLNWTAANAVIANSATTACGTGASAGKIDITAGGGGSTNAIVDVFGYYL
jgi:hypothetical protein